MKAALLGIEHPHSLAHLGTLQALPEIDGIVLWDPSRSALTAARQKQGDKIIDTTTDLNEILGRDDLFFAIAALRNDLGPDIFIRLLQGGLHLLAEKPIGRTAADTLRVMAAAQETGKKLGVCYQNRSGPLIQQARNFVSQGLLGPLLSVEVRLLTTQVQFRNPQHWLFDKERSGGGILSWLGCHYLDMIRYVAQDEIVSVTAEMATRNDAPISVEDIATVSMRLKSGAVASLHAGYTLALSGGGYHNPSGYDTYFGVNGRLGRMYWGGSGRSNHLEVETTHPDWASAPQRRFDFDLAQSAAYGGVSGEHFVRAFIGAAQGQGALPAGGADALQVARIVDAAYASNDQGQRIEVEGPAS
ncbi:MAG: hypothetical protein GKR89_20585 [Candidatus Latescibacteria bacterium]|nr:hypothetical protein [Candidatus Latescibacterota bacterium]